MNQQSCDFPKCNGTRVTDTGMCELHRRVRIHPSYVNDNHLEGGHG
jgi:hypothetical protein